MATDYKEVLRLMDIEDDQQRGYKFEQIIREILPWEHRPPITGMTRSEQFDAIFMFAGHPYLVEVKAKKTRITPGSHDWEDFALKVIRRKNNLAALFISLFALPNSIFDDAADLVKQGHRVIVLDKSFWEDIATNHIPLEHVLEYMMLFGSIKSIAKPPDIQTIIEWRFERQHTDKEITNCCKHLSSTFLRRFKIPEHEKIYVSREIDTKVVAYAKQLRPSSLQQSLELGKLKMKKVRQLCLLRDLSGSGKTTFALEQAIQKDIFFGTGITANQQAIDTALVDFIESLGSYHGLPKLKTLNKPIVFVVDSLDEVMTDIESKKRELNSMIRFLEEELNPAAQRSGLMTFPILLVYTIREEYWRNWESAFEGRLKYDLKNIISVFTESELPIALKKYGDAFDYSIVNEPDAATRAVLSHPINLHIVSQTHKHQGEVVIENIWETSVLDTYFSRKQDDLSKHRIEGLTKKVFFKLLSLLAMLFVRQKRNFLEEDSIEQVIAEKFPNLEQYIEDIILGLSGEQILIKDSERVSLAYRFMHNRYLEYLMAVYIVEVVEKEKGTQSLDNLTQITFDSGLVLMYRVHDDIRHISKQKYPETYKLIEKFYASSRDYMTKRVTNLRAAIAIGKSTGQEDLNLILKNASKNDPTIVYDSFFIFCSKINQINKEDLVTLFVLAFPWLGNRARRYKMIAKLPMHSILLNDKIVTEIFKSDNPKDWEVFLWAVYESQEITDFKEIWKQLEGGIQLARRKRIEREDWFLTEHLLDTILTHKLLLPGDFLK
jgi:hypothetical protein